jgi:hypothetical protein
MNKFLWALALCVASVASAQDTVKLLPTSLELPTRLGPLQFDGKPHQYEPTALGVSYQYNGAGLSLTIYVYDAGVAEIPDGGDTVLNCHLFEQTKREIGMAGYSNVRLISEQLVRLAPPADAPLAREGLFELVRSGEETISYVWITGVAKHFVKVRFSMGTKLRHEAQAARRFLLTALGEAVKPHLAPVDPAARNSRVTFNMVGGTGQEEMRAGILYLTMLASAADKTPEARPLCGGELVPSYETELGVFKAMFALGDEGKLDALPKPMTELISAGFLEEFVWMDRHRNTWGNVAPEGLTLADYQSWKSRNGQFTPPRLGSVVFNQPRPMAIEAPEAP